MHLLQLKKKLNDLLISFILIKFFFFKTEEIERRYIEYFIPHSIPILTKKFIRAFFRQMFNSKQVYLIISNTSLQSLGLNTATKFEHMKSIGSFGKNVDEESSSLLKLVLPMHKITGHVYLDSKFLRKEKFTLLKKLTSSIASIPLSILILFPLLFFYLYLIY